VWVAPNAELSAQGAQVLPFPTRKRYKFSLQCHRIPRFPDHFPFLQKNMAEE
jgi:hypothetical protein